MIVVEGFQLDSPRTKTLVSFLEAVEAGGNVIDLPAGPKRDLYLSARNIPGVLVRQWGEASAYEILWADLVVVEESALADSGSTAKADSAEKAE